MLVNPVQQTPLAYDAARQSLLPPAPVDIQPQQQPATPPIQQSDTPQDKFQPRDGGGGSRQGAGANDRDAAANADQLRAAYVRLQQLKEEANQALIAGDARGAKQAAEEAAQVAVSIENITGSSPDVSLGPVEMAADQISAHDDSSTASSGGDDSSSGEGSEPGSNTTTPDDGGSVPAPVATGASSSPATVIDIARASLGTAREVVDTAAAVPSHPVADRVSIDGYKRVVLGAIAGVEAIAARLLGVATAGSGGSTKIDIKA